MGTPNPEWQGGEIGILSFGGSLMSVTIPTQESWNTDLKTTKWKHVTDEIEVEDIDIETTHETAEIHIGQLSPFEMNGGVNMQDWEQSWELRKVNVDSGAIDNGCNKETGKDFCH